MKILFIPYAQKSGTVERIPNLIRILSKKHSVVGLSPVHFDWAPNILERTIEPIKMALSSREFKDIDMAFASQNRYALPGLLISKLSHRPLIFDSHGNPELLCDNLNADCLFRLRNVLPEKLLRKRIKRLITVSEADRTAYVKMGFKKEAISVVPTCVDFERFKVFSREEARRKLNLPSGSSIALFFGSYSYPPNVEALEYINNELAPIMPETDIILAGSGRPKVDCRPNVHFKGYVDDLDILIDAVDICIAPIWHGVGILEKVLQMMAHGKPTVVTTLANRGIPELRDGVNCFIAAEKSAFTQKTLSLINDIGGAASLGENARELIYKKYNWSLYEDILAGI